MNRILPLILIFGCFTLTAQPYKNGLDRFITDLRIQSEGIAGEMANQINALSGGSASSSELAQSSVYFVRDTTALVGVLLRTDGGYIMTGLHFSNNGYTWRVTDIDVSPFAVSYDSIKMYLRAVRTVLRSNENDFYALKGTECDCPSRSFLDDVVQVMMDDSRPCYNSTAKLPWTWGSFLIPYGNGYDFSYEVHLVEPSSEVDWEKQKPNLIKQLTLLEYAMATQSKVRVEEQRYMEKAGLFGQLVLYKEYSGVYMDDWWKVYITFENQDRWTLYWEVKRAPVPSPTEADFRTPELDLSGAFECLSGNCTTGEGVARFTTSNSTYKGRFVGGSPNGPGSLELSPELRVEANFVQGLVRDSAVIIGPQGHKTTLYAPESRSQWASELPISNLGVWYTGSISRTLIPNGKGFVKRKDLYASVEMDMGAIIGMDSAWMDLGNAYYIGRLDASLQPHGRGKLLLKDRDVTVSFSSDHGKPQMGNVTIEWGSDSLYVGPVAAMETPHGYGYMKKGSEELQGDWYYGKYVGSLTRYAEEQRAQQAKDTRTKIIERIRKQHGLDLRSQQLYAGYAKPQIAFTPKNGFQLEPNLVLWNLSEEDMTVQVKMRRSGLQNSIKQTYEIPSVRNGNPYRGSKMSFYSLDTQVLEIKVVKGSYEDLYVVIK